MPNLIITDVHTLWRYIIAKGEWTQISTTTIGDQATISHEFSWALGDSLYVFGGVASAYAGYLKCMSREGEGGKLEEFKVTTN